MPFNVPYRYVMCQVDSIASPSTFVEVDRHIQVIRAEIVVVVVVVAPVGNHVARYM